MKNFYVNLKAVVCTLVGATMLFASCGHDPYDDTELRNEIANLFAKVDALEKKLSEEVNALKTLIETAQANLSAEINSKTVVTSATQKEDGTWEIILSTGEKITVHPKFVPTPQEPEKNEGCITVVEEGGVYYWAIITNGTATALLDKDGNKVAITHNDQPLFTFDSATGEVKVSVDGGATWVIVEKAAESETEEPTCIFTGVVDGKNAIEFTLADGSVISIPKAEEIDFGVQAGKTFVKPGESVEIKLTAKNIDDLTVIAKPEGWKASILDKVLTVTAPAQEAIDNGSAELEGAVKIHAAGGDGKCMVGKVIVSASDASLSLEVSGDVLTIYNNVITEGWWGPQLAPALYGISEADAFSADAIAKGMNDYSLDALQCYDQVGTASVKALYNQMIAKIYDEASWIEVPAGKSYVIWAISQSSDYDHVYAGEEVVYTIVTPPYLTFTETLVAFNAVEFTVEAGGYDSYIYGSMKGSLEEAKEQIKWSFTDWKDGWGTFGAETSDINFSGSVMDFNYMGWDQTITPGSSYVAFVLPMIAGKPIAEYEMEDIVFFSASSAPLAAGGSATLTITAREITFTTVDVEITGSDNTTMIFAAPLTEGEMAQYQTDDELLEYVIAYCNEYGQIQLGNKGEAFVSSLAPGENAYIAAIAVDEEGKYSTLYKEKFTTKAISFNEALKVKIDEQASKVDVASAAIKVTAEGGTPVKYRYVATETSGYYWMNSLGGNVSSAEGKMALETNYYINDIAVDALVDGCIQLTGLETGTEYIIVVMAFGEDGMPSRATSYTFTPSLPEYPVIRSNNDAYAAAKPAYDVTVKWNADYGRFDVDCAVTPAAGTVKYWVAVLDEEFLTAEAPVKDAIDYLLIKEGQYYGSESFTAAATYSGNTYDTKASVWITWTDAEGNYYQCISERIFPTPIAKDADAWKASQPTITTTLVDEADGSKTLNYTVTPGAGVTNMWIYTHPGELYYNEDTTTFMVMLNPESVQSATAYTGSKIEVTESAVVAVTWTDAEGNIYTHKKSTDQ